MQAAPGALSEAWAVAAVIDYTVYNILDPHKWRKKQSFLSFLPPSHHSDDGSFLPPTVCMTRNYEPMEPKSTGRGKQEFETPTS